MSDGLFRACAISALDSGDTLIRSSANGPTSGLAVQSRKVKQDACVDGDYRLTESGVNGIQDISGTRADDCTVPSAV